MKESEWINSLRIPENYPEVTLGWPDEEHGITPGAWMDYCDELAEDAAFDGADYQPLSWEEWRDEQRDSVGEDIEFSHQDCDLCGAKPGARTYATAWRRDEDGLLVEDDYVALEICADCACWIANGDVPDHLELDDN